MQTEKANKGIGYETLCLHHNAFAGLPASDCGTRTFRFCILGCGDGGLYQRNGYQTCRVSRRIADACLATTWRALQQLEKDLQYKHSKRDYKFEAIFNIRIPPVLTVRRTYTVEGDNGINVLNLEHAQNGPLSFDGPYSVTLQDSADIEWHIATGSYENKLHLEMGGTSRVFYDLGDVFSNFKLEKIYKGLLNVYDVTAYCIGDETGRGVYRIHLEEKEKQKTQEAQMHFANRKMKWYMDCQSLRLIQVNEDRGQRGWRILYRNDFGEENGTPVLKKSIKISSWGGYMIRRTSIQLVEK